METLLLPPSPGAPSSLGQALLFSPEIELRIEEEESRGLYTAERALVKRPGLKEAVIQLRAAGEGYLSIAAKLNCHHRTASAIATLFAENVDMERAKRVNRLRSAADKLVELIDNEPNSVPANVRALAASQLYDKAELLDGRATQRIERTERIDIYKDWEETVEKLLDPSCVVEIDSPAGIGLGDENVSAIGEPGERADLGAGDACIDAESAALTDDAEVDCAAVTGSDTDVVTDLGAVTHQDQSGKQGGEGVSCVEGGPHCQIDTKDQKFSGNGSQTAERRSI